MSDLLDKLPLFATDHEIAVAIVGKERAEMWRKTALPQLEARGFPRYDTVHNGRPTALVRMFYDGYLGVSTATVLPSGADGGERLGQWKKHNADKRAENKARGERATARKREALEQHRAKKAAKARD